MEDTDIQWHPGFVAAMDLELRDNRDDLVFDKEYNLNTKPLEIDLLIIKKNPDARIGNEIGQIFRGHNILEYKSPRDHLDIDTFYKVGAYASLYKAYGRTLDAIRAEDVTVSLVREARPDGLFQYFKENGGIVSNPYPGVYYVEKPVLFPTQVVVTRELKPGGHIWLRSLSESMGKQDMAELLETVRRLTGKQDRELADSVLNVSTQANQRIIEELRGDGSMSPVLMEIMEPELRMSKEEGIKEGIKEGLEEGIHGSAKILRDLGYKEMEIQAILARQYSLSEEEAGEYVRFGK